MASFNYVLLLGNLTRDPELKEISPGRCVCGMGMAVNRRYSTSSGEEREETCFVDVDVWGNQAQSCANYLQKGSQVLVEGRLRFNEWQDRETGARRTRLTVQAQRVQFMSRPAPGSFDRPEDTGPQSRYAQPSSGDKRGTEAGQAGMERSPMPDFEPIEDDDGASDDTPF